MLKWWVYFMDVGIVILLWTAVYSATAIYKRFVEYLEEKGKDATR